MLTKLGEKKKLSILILVAISAFSILSYFIASKVVKNEEVSVAARLEKVIGNIAENDAVKFGVKGVKKICFQPPYASKADFERISGEVINNYNTMESDGMLGIHYFFENGSYELVQFSGKVIRLDRERVVHPCSEAGELSLKRSGSFVLIGFS
jgi:hypothetical protein